MTSLEAARHADRAWREYRKHDRGLCEECNHRRERWLDTAYGLQPDTWCGCPDDTRCPAARAREER